MLILIPVDNNDEDEAQISLIDKAKYWVLLEFNEGRVHNTTFYNTKEEIEGWLDVVIIKDTTEYVWPFEELGMAVLVAPMQRYIEDIMEAFIFKELHDYANSYNKA
jgi:predicted Fe-Mo cluster-binding NifX family protein